LLEKKEQYAKRGGQEEKWMRQVFVGEDLKKNAKNDSTALTVCGAGYFYIVYLVFN